MRKRLVKKYTIFIAIPFVLILLFEITCRVLNVPKIVHFRIEPKLQEQLPQIDNNTILFLGDSRIEWGIRPDIVEAAAANKNLKVINMASPGSNGLDILDYLIANSIYPKLIVMGYTANYGRYTNFNANGVNLSFLNKIFHRFRYIFKSHFYISDQSLFKYLQKEKIYFKSLEYDDKGGGRIFVNGDFSERLAFQKQLYEYWRNTYRANNFLNFVANLNSKIDILKDSSMIVGLYMPVSKPIQQLEPLDTVLSEPAKFDTLYNLKNYTYQIDSIAPDSIYFLDGSHLDYEYSKTFSIDLAGILKLDEI